MQGLLQRIQKKPHQGKIPGGATWNALPHG